MKNLLWKALVMAVVLSFSACSETELEDMEAPAALKSSTTAKKGYIVLLNDQNLNQELVQTFSYQQKQKTVKSFSEKLLKRADILDGTIDQVYGNSIKGFAVKMAPGQLKKLELDPSVIHIEEDQVVSLIFPLGKPSKVPSTPVQTTPWGITRVGGAVNYTGSNVAWIIDSGVDLTHPDLNVDVTRAANFTTAKSANDDNGHGSHVAGTIAAINNTQGVVGVAAGATVVPVKVLDRRGNGTLSGVIAGIDYVAANASPNDVANMSLGGGISTALDDAVLTAAQKCRFVIAAGNEAINANNSSPARVNGPNIYTISAMDSNDQFAYFSNYGNPPVDFCAPGVSILSCYKGGGYTTYSGTSMAAPHVAGILLLGSVRSDGSVSGDKDSTPDAIAHR